MKSALLATKTMAEFNITRIIENISIVANYNNCKCIVPEASLPLTWRLFIIVNLVFTVIVYVKMFFLKDKLELNFTREQISNYAYKFLGVVIFYVYTFTFIDFLTRSDSSSLLFKVVAPVYLIVGYLLARKLSKDLSD